ncbi:cation-translocating P-type ATPase [Streptomyces sp. TR06-5]|uniref:cation-translocating P-type ATPase n=1 Tax=unclassified Streptomyces TaxID=2593676 RepID=UPI0039A24B97
MAEGAARREVPAGPRGLSEAEASLRLSAHGPNVVTTARHTPVWRRLLQQLRDPLILVLLVAAALTLATRDYSDALVIAFVVVVNTAVGVAQEVRAERAITALRSLSAPTARVMRDGTARSVPSAEVVSGDVVVLAEGDIVPADGSLVDAAALLVDESSVTGESVPVDKTATGDEPGGDAVRTVSAGTVVVRGRGLVTVTGTGAESALGRIASLLGTAPGLTPLQHRLARFGRLLAAVTVVLCTVVLAAGLARGQPLELMVITAISLAVAAVPESLPAVVTLALALGARRMAARNAIVRRLPAVETLGSVTVIASDKTGTLTQGRMSAEHLWTPSGAAVATGHGYDPAGRVARGGRTVTAEDAPDLERLLRCALLCNDAALQPPTAGGGSWTALGDPMEAALLVAGARFGLDRSAVDATWPRVREVPFDSGRKRMTTVHRGADGLLVVCKGAPEVLLRSGVLVEDGTHRAEARREAEQLAAAGYRVLAVASARRPPTAPLDAPPESWESGLQLAGLIGVMDPPRAEAADTVRACRDAGIVPVVVTGDHPLTARAVADRLGMPTGPGDVATGTEAESDGTRGTPLRRVHARTSPEQKVGIVRAWRRSGHVVAMTGDGVNDGPALHEADIGVAMGRRGTEVARQAADLVLVDDDLGTVVAAVEEGRRVYANVRRFLLYGLAGGSAEILVMLLGPFLGLTLPLLPAQILWINLLTHGLPGVALGAEPVDRGVMRRPPRPPAESVLGAGLWPRIVLMGVVIGVVTLGAGVWAFEAGRAWQSLVFLVLGVAQLGVALGSRARPGTLANPFLVVAVAVALALQAAGVFAAPLRSLLGTEPVGLLEVGVAGVSGVVCYLVMRAQAAVRPEHRR